MSDKYIDEIIDLLLDQEGFECDPISLREGDTPLHSAARYINSLPPSAESTEWAASFLSLMTDAGSDARIRNKASLTPAQLIDPRLPELKRQLEEAAEEQENGGEVAEMPLSKHELAALEREQADQEEGDVGSASDSDFDPEEYQREKERRQMGNAEGGFI